MLCAMGVWYVVLARFVGDLALSYFPSVTCFTEKLNQLIIKDTKSCKWKICYHFTTLFLLY